MALASAGSARGEGLTYDWIGTGTGLGYASAWNQADNWATVPGGAAGIPSYENADTVTITQGEVNVGRKGLGSAVMDVSGGALNLLTGKNLTVTDTLTVRDAGVVQVGGHMNVGALDMRDGGRIEIPSFDVDRYGVLSIANETEMTGGVISVGGELFGGTLTLSGGSIEGPGRVGFSALTQTGGDISGVTLEVTYYDYLGGTFSGAAEVYGAFRLSDNYGETLDTVAIEAGTVITGVVVEEPVMFYQDGNTRMSGEVLGFDTYDQTGGLMDGKVSAGQYLLGGTGTAAGTIDFLTYAQVRDDAVVTADAVLTGAEGAWMEQIGGTMNGTVSGIDSYLQWQGEMGGNVSTGTYTAIDGTVSGSVEFSQAFELLESARVTSTTKLFQTGGSMGNVVEGIDTYKQSGGSIDGWVGTRTFELAGGEGVGFDHVSISDELIQSGGTLDVFSFEVPVFTQSGGAFNGNISVEDYNLTGGSATADGVITASKAFNLGPDSGTVDLEARLDGAANLVKTGDSRVILRNSGSAFTGTVTVSGGVLEAINDALPDAATVSVAEGATLQFSTNITQHVKFAGTITGDTGTLVKAGRGILTLSGNIELGALAVDFGTLNIGDGTTTETASFDSAVIAAKSTLYVAKNATLEIRVPNNLTNYGTLINDGTVIDDLDNANIFNNNGIYKANVASNTGTINNNTPGVWTGNVLANGGTINNNDGSTWKGDVKANAGTIFNAAGATWTGSVASTGGVSNEGHWTGDVVSNTFGYIDNVGADAIWTGDVLASNSRISNYEGAHWIGDVANNTNVIYNKSTWTGDIDGNGSSSNHDGIIQNYGTWTGDIKRNFGGLVVIDGAWTGDIVGNAGWIVNNGNDLIENLHGVNATIWDGDVTNGSGTISNDYNGIWTGDVLDNSGPAISGGRIENYGAWAGDVLANHGAIMNIAGSWTGDIISNSGRLINNWNNNSSNVGGINHAVWNGDVSTFEAVINDTGGIWNGRVLGNNNAIYNYVGAEWTGNVVANGGGSNVHAQIVNFGVWDGDVESNSGGIYSRDGSWDGDILANAGWIYNNYNDTDNPDGVNATVWTGDVTNTTGRVVNDHFGIWSGNVLANGGTITNRSDGTWTGNVVANLGTITTAGKWVGDITSAGTLNAEGRIEGAVTNSGVMNVTGALAGLGALTTTGTLNMSGGGAHDTVNAASASFGLDATFGIDVGPGGLNDRLAVTGAASLAGMVHVTAGSGMNSGDYTTPYVFLTAGSLSGSFDGATTNLAFLSPYLTQDNTLATVAVTLQRNTQEFTAVGVTDNQKAVAGEVEGLGEGNALYDSVIWLTPEEAQAAFDQLSGEVYATAKAAAVENATRVSDVAFQRLGSAADGIDSRGSASSFTSGPSEELSSGGGFWSTAQSVFGTTEGGNGTSSAEGRMGAVAFGVDGLLGGWRLGVMGDAGTSSTDVAALGSSVTSTDYGMGVYGGTSWGDTELRFAAAYSRHDNSSSRSVVYPGYTDELSAEYASNTAQVAGEISHEFALGPVGVTPFARAAYISHATDGFSETGGAAALTYVDDVAVATIATIGASVEYQMVVGDDMLLTASASLGWRHASAGDLYVDLALEGGTPVAIVGAGMSDTTALGAGLYLDVSDTAAFEVTYAGQIGSNAQTHALSGTWAAKF